MVGGERGEQLGAKVIADGCAGHGDDGLRPRSAHLDWLLIRNVSMQKNPDR
jgi:hypothetical protein